MSCNLLFTTWNELGTVICYFFLHCIHQFTTRKGRIFFDHFHKCFTECSYIRINYRFHLWQKMLLVEPRLVVLLFRIFRMFLCAKNKRQQQQVVYAPQTQYCIRNTTLSICTSRLKQLFLFEYLDWCKQ